MSVFQYVVVPLCVVLGLLGLRSHVIDLKRVIWSAFWFLSALSIAFPASVTMVANLLGIGRGTDFVLYLALLLQPVVWGFLFRRIQGLQAQITLLVRDDAIANVIIKDEGRVCKNAERI